MQFTNHLRAAGAAAALVFLMAGCSSVKLDEQPQAPITDAGKPAEGADARVRAPPTVGNRTRCVDCDRHEQQ